MNRLSHLIAVVSLLLVGNSIASPAEAQQIQKEWALTIEKWELESRVATTPEARAKAFASRPDVTPVARRMWSAFGSELKEDWTLEPAAWFLRATPGLLSTNANGSTSPTFAKEIEAIRKAVETHHLKSKKLIPVCMAMVTNQDPRSLAILEKIEATHPDPKTQGVAALAAAMVIKTLGDDADLMRKRLTYLRKAIIESAEIELGGTTVAKLAEDELYIIRYLTKGRVAPDLSGLDAAGRPLKLSDYKGKVVMLLFWSSAIQEAERVVKITAATSRKFQGRPFAVIGVNHDTLEKLRSMEADESVTWPNFSDPNHKLAAEYRVGSWPRVYVLDGERRIHYSGGPGSFAELTAEALLGEMKPTPDQAPPKSLDH
jgi:peroxiredoxin